MKALTTTHGPRPAGSPRLLPTGFLLALLGLLGPPSAQAATSVQVFAEFSSTVGEAGVREVRLWLDGLEVTEAAAVSSIRISYELPGDFPTGKHEARVVVVDSLGRSHEKTWTFEVSESRTDLVAFFTDRLTVLLDPLPRRTLLSRFQVSGSSLPGVEIELRRAGVPVARTETSLTGRFSLPVELEDGENELSVAAFRPTTGEVGPELRLRMQRLLVSDPIEAADPGDELEPREAEPLLRHRGRGGPEAPTGPNDRGLPGDESIVVEPRRSELPPGASLRGRRDAPSAPADVRLPGETVDGFVVITKPTDGDFLLQSKVTVLGRAPASWQVLVRVNGVAGGSDQANPAGHFTIPQVRLEAGSNELVAEAREPGTSRVLVSEPVLVSTEPGALGVAFTTPSQGSQTVRGSTWRLEGFAGSGAEFEVEVNGRLVLTEVAGFDGRFALLVPLEPGLNRIVVETFAPGGLQGLRSRTLNVRRVGQSRSGERIGPSDGPLLEREALPGRGGLPRLRPLH